jgi:hypothetical protein
MDESSRVALNADRVRRLTVTEANGMGLARTTTDGCPEP